MKIDQEYMRQFERAAERIDLMFDAFTAQSEWQPIKTAPRNGQNILGCKDGIMATVRWMTVEKYWTLCVPGTFTLYHDWDPQFWMPLPDVPGIEEV